MINAAVTEITKEKKITVVAQDGMHEIEAKAVILAMGCRERSRGALGIPGERPAGVFTAGTAQAYMNLYNRMPAKEVVILGSGEYWNDSWRAGLPSREHTFRRYLRLCHIQADCREISSSV